MTDSVSGIYVWQNIRRIKVVTKKMSLTERSIIARSLEIEGGYRHSDNE